MADSTTGLLTPPRERGCKDEFRRTTTRQCTVPRTRGVHCRQIAPRTREHCTIAGVVLAHLALTIPLAGWLNLWLDEFTTLQTTGHGMGYAIERSITYELQPPFYFALLSVWRAVNQSDFIARLFSVCCAAATLPVVAALSRRHLRNVSPVWATAAAAFNPFLIWAATEVRVYALAILLSSLLMLWFHDGFLRIRSLPAARWKYALVALAALYTQYYLGFLLAAHGAALLAMRRWRPLRSYVLLMAVVAVGFLPMARYVPSQLTGHGAAVYEYDIAAATGHVTRIARRYVVQISPLRVAEKLIWVAACVAGVAICFRKRRQFLRRRNVGVWLTAAILLLVFCGLSPLAGPGLTAQRHLVGLFLPAIFAVFLVMRTVGRRTLIGFAVIVLVGNTITLADHYQPLRKPGDWRRVAEYLMQHEAPRQPIAVFRPNRIAALAHYYAGTNMLVPIPRPNDEQVYNLAAHILTSEAEIAAAIDRIHAEPETLWLVTSGRHSSLGIDFRSEILDAYVHRVFDVVQEADFESTNIKQLRRKPQSPASTHPPSQRGEP